MYAMSELMMSWFEYLDAGDTASEVFMLECLLHVNDERAELSNIPSVWA